MTKAVSPEQRNLFETEQQHIERLAQQAEVIAVMGPKPPVQQWFTGISNEQYDNLVLTANSIKERIGIVHSEGDSEYLDKLWDSYSFQIDILMMYNPRGVCEMADEAEVEIQKLVSRLNVLDDEGEDVREMLTRYELLCDQCIMLGGKPS